MIHLIKTNRSNRPTVEVALRTSADGQGLVIDTATDAEISRIHDRFSDAASALSRMSDIAKFRRGIGAIIVDTPDASPSVAPN